MKSKYAPALAGSLLVLVALFYSFSLQSNVIDFKNEYFSTNLSLTLLLIGQVIMINKYLFIFIINKLP